MAEKFEEIFYEDKMGQAYVDYAMSVITERALPDILDGLKPVQRRVLFALSELTKSTQDNHRKSARIVGDTMGKYHPHGDLSIYDALVNMAQPWKLNIPLVDPHGNFGSVDGDGAAAMRYTEVKATKFFEDTCMQDLKYMDWMIPNFDNTEEEPRVLPFQVPNMLLTGTMGIAVGMTTNIPTHNLNELLDAFILYIRNENATLDELLSVLKGPDFATGGILNTDYDTLKEIYATGKGKMKVRGVVEVRDIGYGRKSICVTEIPFTMIGRTGEFLNKVEEIARNENLSAIVEVADRSDRNEKCLCIDVKKGTSDETINRIINILYKKTGLEDTYGVYMHCIDNGDPKCIGLIPYFKRFLEFKKDIYTTKYQKLLKKQKEDCEVQEGLMRAVSSEDELDLIIEIIRGSKKISDAIDCMVNGNTKNIRFRYKGSEMDAKNLNYTERQAEAIVNMRLRRLVGLELDTLKKEYAQAKKLLKEYEKIVSSPSEMQKIMISDLEKIKQEYGFKRKTVIKDCGTVVVEEIEEEAVEVGVLVDRFYYIKVVDGSIYDKNIESIEQEYRFHLKCMSSDRIQIFDNKEKMHTIKLSDVLKIQSKKNQSKGKKSGGSIMGKMSDKGIQIFEFCNMDNNEDIMYLGCTEQNKDLMYVFVSKDGKAKLVSGDNFDVTRKCIDAYRTDMAFISPVTDEKELVTKSCDGYYIRVSISDIPAKGKGAGGKILMSLKDNDNIEKVWIGRTSDCIDGGISFTRIKPLKMGARGTKIRI